MIVVSLEKDSGNELSGFIVKGHALYAPHGEDIVCSAVSVLTQTAVLALKELVGAELKVSITEGNMVCRVIPSGDAVKREKTSLILESMLLGLRETEKSYPDFLKIDG